MPKPDHIFNLEQRLQAIEKDIADTLLLCSADDPMIADLNVYEMSPPPPPLMAPRI